MSGKTIEIRVDQDRLKAALADSLSKQIDPGIVDEAIKEAIRNTLNDRFEWSNHGGKVLRDLAAQVVEQRMKELLKEELETRIEQLREYVTAAIKVALDAMPTKEDKLVQRIRQGIANSFY